MYGLFVKVQVVFEDIAPPILVPTEFDPTPFKVTSEGVPKALCMIERSPLSVVNVVGEKGTVTI